MKYIKILWKNQTNEYPDKIFYEIGEDLYNTRIITHYPNGDIKAADEKGGFRGQIIAEGPLWKESINELNNPPELITVEITKEEFEDEWQKATSQAGFELVPYSSPQKNGQQKLA